MLEVEARQALRRDDQPRAVRKRREVTDEPRRQLAVAVQRDPDLARRRDLTAEGVVARGSRNADVVLGRVGQRVTALNFQMPLRMSEA